MVDMMWMNITTTNTTTITSTRLLLQVLVMIVSRQRHKWSGWLSGDSCGTNGTIATVITGNSAAYDATAADAGARNLRVKI